MKKFILTDETKTFSPDYGTTKVTLHRIRSLINFKNVHEGDLGGWVEKESNLSQSGDAWVSGEAKVFGDAYVQDNAQVLGRAVAMGKAKIIDDATVTDDAFIRDHAIVGDHSYLADETTVAEFATIYGKLSIVGLPMFGGHAYITSDYDYMTVGPFKGLLGQDVTFYYDLENDDEDGRLSVTTLNVYTEEIYTCTAEEFIVGKMFKSIPRRLRIGLTVLADIKLERCRNEEPDYIVRDDNREIVNSPIYFVR